MNWFLPDYNDPIVSILLLLGIIFIIATLSYTYNIWKEDKKRKELFDFVKKFDSNECLLDINNLIFEESMIKPLFLLSAAYKKSGDYSKAINILLFLIKHTKDDSYLLYLADAYFKAGFLERSKNIFLEILSKYPKDITALYKLELIYEKLNRFNEAKEVLEILKELNEDVSDLELNLVIIKILKSSNNKFKDLEKLLDRFSGFRWVIVKELFRLDAKNAFKYYEDYFFEKIVDILYMLKLEQIDLDIIAESKNLQELYFIKGYILKINNKSGIFSLNLLSSAKEAGFNKGRLYFVYICKKCKNRYPIYFKRCPNCNKAFKIKVEILIGEKYERGDSLL